MTMLRSISTVLTLIATSGCALVAGTSDYEPCGEGEGGCGEGGDGSGASSSTSTSSTTSTSSAGGCFDVSIEVTGNVEVFVDGNSSFDVDDEGARTFCLAPGEHSIAAFCDQSGSDTGPAVDVNWGNTEHCTEAGQSCVFSLQKDEEFFVTLLNGSDCPS